MAVPFHEFVAAATATTNAHRIERDLTIDPRLAAKFRKWRDVGTRSNRSVHVSLARRPLVAYSAIFNYEANMRLQSIVIEKILPAEDLNKMNTFFSLAYMDPDFDREYFMKVTVGRPILRRHLLQGAA
ncbi:hypothetical protein M1D34_29360 (plasmid) [Ensifer sp. D2-11]